MKAQCFHCGLEQHPQVCSLRSAVTSLSGLLRKPLSPLSAIPTYKRKVKWVKDNLSNREEVIDRLSMFELVHVSQGFQPSKYCCFTFGIHLICSTLWKLFRWQCSFTNTHWMSLDEIRLENLRRHAPF